MSQEGKRMQIFAGETKKGRSVRGLVGGDLSFSFYGNMQSSGISMVPCRPSAQSNIRGSSPIPNRVNERLWVFHCTWASHSSVSGHHVLQPRAKRLYRKRCPCSGCKSTTLNSGESMARPRISCWPKPTWSSTFVIVNMDDLQVMPGRLHVRRHYPVSMEAVAARQYSLHLSKAR